MKHILFLCCFAVIALHAGNVSICGTNYGRHDIKQIINRVLVRKDVIYQHADIGTQLNYDKYKDSAMLIVCSSLEKSPSADEIEKLKNWIRNGGVALFTGRAINSLAPARELKWTCLSSPPTQTPAVMLGVYPMNHPSELSLVVPVLPAICPLNP